MKLVHKVVIPATVIFALSVGTMVHGYKEIKGSSGENILNPIRVVKNSVPVDTEKNKFSAAKKKAMKNKKKSLDNDVENGKITREEADSEFLKFVKNITDNFEKSFNTKALALDEINFRAEFYNGLYNQAKNGKITFERANDIYNNFVDITV